MQSSTRKHDARAQPNSREEALSAFLDGEADDAWPLELDTPKGRQDWDTYHLIGDVLRSPALAIPVSDKWRVRLAGALEQEPTVMVPRRTRTWRMGLSGLAVAAAVASVAWVAKPYFSATESAPVPVLADNRSSDTPGLLDYVDAHREVASPGGVRQVSFDGGL